MWARAVDKKNWKILKAAQNGSKWQKSKKIQCQHWCIENELQINNKRQQQQQQKIALPGSSAVATWSYSDSSSIDLIWQKTAQNGSKWLKKDLVTAVVVVASVDIVLIVLDQIARVVNSYFLSVE